MPDLDRAKIDVHSLQIVEEYSNGQFNLVWNKISKLSINLDIKKGRLLGNFARNQFSQFSDALTTEKSQALTWQSV